MHTLLCIAHALYIICCTFDTLYINTSGFPIVGGGAWGEPGGCSPNLQFFFSKPSPLKLMPPMGCPPHLKMNPPPSEKQAPSLKREAPFHEMNPRKSTRT